MIPSPAWLAPEFRLEWDPQGHNDLWFEGFGIWVKPVPPGLRDASTDGEALAWVLQYRDGEVSGGW